MLKILLDRRRSFQYSEGYSLKAQDERVMFISVGWVKSCIGDIDLQLAKSLWSRISASATSSGTASLFLSLSFADETLSVNNSQLPHSIS